MADIDVIGIDAPCMDMLVNVKNLPEPNSSSQFLNASWQGGGKAATAMIAAARLGSRAGIIANLGGDLYGDVIEWDFIRHGVDISHLNRMPDTYTSLSLVLSDRETMGRSIIWQGGGAPLVDKVDRDYIGRVKYLHVPGMHGVFGSAAEMAREAGVQIVIDADRYDEAVMKKLEMIDVFIGSEFFFDRISENGDIEECCRRIQGQGPGIVVFTFGEKGCSGIGQDGVFFSLPSYKVQVADTTGAGDVFHGAFIHGLLQGWDAQSCAEFSSAVSALKVTKPGGRAGIPDAKMTEEFIMTGKTDFPELNEREKWYAGALDNTIMEMNRESETGNEI